MSKTLLAIVLMATLSACGDGGSSSDNGGAKASLTFTPVQDVAALVGTQSATLTATRAATSWSPISAAYADDVSTTVELIATDVGGNQFKTNLLICRHVRTYAEKRGEYLDFVMSRFRGMPELLDASPHGREQDVKWNGRSDT
jgi:hypothetical protein